MRTLKINGIDKEFPSEKIPQTLSELLEQMNINHATVVAEIDGQIVKRKDFSKTELNSGQSIELVRFVGGG